MEGEIRLAVQEFLHHLLIFFGGGGAGNIKQDPARGQVRRGLPENSLLEPGKAAKILGLPPPAQFRVSAQHPETGAGGIDEEAIKAVVIAKRQGAGRVG